MTQTQKYQFDVEFDATGQILRSPTEINAFSLEEVEHIKAQAFEDGQESETARAANIASDALTQIAKTTVALTEHLNAEALKNKKAAFDLAVIAAKKIAGSALDAFPCSEIESTIEICLAEMPDESRLVVAVSSDLQDTITSKIESIAQDQNFEGRIRVTGTNELAPGDCKVEWGDGGIARQAQHIEDKIVEIVSRRLISEAAEIGQLDLFTPTTGDLKSLPADE